VARSVQLSAFAAQSTERWNIHSGPDVVDAEGGCVDGRELKRIDSKTME